MINRKTSNCRGFTLFEIIVSVVVIAILMATVVPMVSALTGTYQRTASLKLAGNIKYLYDRAILERLYIRLVFDLDNNTYWSESTRDPFFLSLKPLDVEDGAVVIKEDEEEEEEFDPFGQDVLFDDPENYKWQGWTDFANKFRKKKAAFSTYRTELTTKTEIPEQVKLYRVDTQAVEEPIYSGQIYIHFFPNGYVEKAVIWLADASDYEDEEIPAEEIEVFSVVVEPLTGRSLILDERLELPEDMEDEESW